MNRHCILFSMLIYSCKKMAKKGKDTHNKKAKYEIEKAHRIKQNQEWIKCIGIEEFVNFSA